MTVKTTPFTIGTDPEFMISAGESVVSAIPIVEGNKTKKTNLGGGFECFHDNVCLETNILPGSTKSEFVGNIRTGIGKIAALIGGQYELTAQASHYFSKTECEHDDAKMVGCSVEWCAYTLEECESPQFTETMRSAGGHIHLGRADYKEYVYVDEDGYTRIKDGVELEGEVLLDMISKMEVIRLMDVFVGLPLVLVDNDPTSPARKSLYGKAGRCRPTPYGVEYRTPSNYWLSSPKLADLIYDLSMHVLNLAKNGEAQSVLSQFDLIDIQIAINENNKELARALMEVAFVDVPKLLERVEAVAKQSRGRLYKEWRLDAETFKAEQA